MGVGRFNRAISVTMAYTDDLNNVSPASQAAAIFDLKEAMKTAGYTVRGSGDGIATHSAVGDIITSAASGAGGIDNTNAWFTVRQSSGGSAPFSGTREWTFQRGAASYSWACEYSGPDTTFDQSTGNATTRPTGVVPGDIKSFAEGAGTQTVFPTTLNFTYQIRVGDSSENFQWFLICYPSGGGNINSRVFFAPVSPDTITATEDDPFILSADNAALTWQTIASITASNVFAWQGKNGTVNTYAEVGALIYQSTAGIVFPAISGSNPQSNEDNSTPIFWGRRSADSSPGFKGGTSTLQWKGNPRVTGELLGSKSKVCFDDTVWPWDGSTDIAL